LGGSPSQQRFHPLFASGNKGVREPLVQDVSKHKYRSSSYELSCVALFLPIEFIAVIIAISLFAIGDFIRTGTGRSNALNIALLSFWLGCPPLIEIFYFNFGNVLVKPH
jgi:hypothetical protein